MYFDVGIGKDRCARLVKFYAENGVARPENRGGARRSDVHDAKHQAVINHISSFTCRASHYARRGAPGRKYLPSDLSIARMYRLFEEQTHDEVSLSLYYSVFRSQFNLGFGHPAAETCSTCTAHRQRVADNSLTDGARQTVSASFLLHCVLSMLFALRKAYFPHLTINFTFPIRGHSFLPADRVFGRIEQDLRRKDTILLLSDYHAVLRSHGALLIYGDD